MVEGAVKIELCDCSTYSSRQHVHQGQYSSKLLLLVVMNMLCLPSHHLSEFCHICTVISPISYKLSSSRTELTLNGFFPWKWTGGAPTTAQARLAALWLFHCSVTVSLFCHLTCMSFALCISGVLRSFSLFPSPHSPPSPPFLDIP